MEVAIIAAPLDSLFFSLPIRDGWRVCVVDDGYAWYWVCVVTLSQGAIESTRFD